MTDLLNCYKAASHPDVSNVLHSIVHTPPFALERASRTELISTILLDLEAAPCGRLQSKDLRLALLALKTLGKQPEGSEILVYMPSLAILLGLASRLAKHDPEASNQALRCIANALLLHESGRAAILETEPNGGDLCATMLNGATSQNQIWVLSRILFLCTLSETPFIRSLVRVKKNGFGIINVIAAKLDVSLTGCLSGQNNATEAMADLLKLTFNLLFRYPMMVLDDSTTTASWRRSISDDLLPPLLRILHSLPPTIPSPIISPLTHLFHALLLIPINTLTRPKWFPQSPSLEPQPETKDPFLHLHDLLETSFAHYFPDTIEPDHPLIHDMLKEEMSAQAGMHPDTQLEDILCPPVDLMARLCRADETCRGRARDWLLPPDLDRSTPLGDRPDMLGRCLRLLSSDHHLLLKYSTGHMLYAISDSDPITFIALFGPENVVEFLLSGAISSLRPLPRACRRGT